MNDSDAASETMEDETRKFWNRVAEDWEIQVGENGDDNRQMNSDPVLWKFAGDVSGLDVLDAGCGSGYLSRKLAVQGAQVVGIDFAENMVELARTNAPDLDFRVDSCTSLGTVESNSVDLVISNYVLMDVSDLEAAVNSFFRVCRKGGNAIVVFSHPCFPQAWAEKSDDRKTVIYNWDYSYFESRKCISPPWGHFTSEFIWFHRPLSRYWKAFTSAGFRIVDFDEPRVTPERFHLAGSERKLHNSLARPYSVAFKLEKP